VEAELLFNYGMTGRAVPPLVEDAVRLVEQSRSGPGGEPTPGEVVRLMLVAFDALLRGEHRLADERLRLAREHLADERLSREVSLLAQITLEEFRGVLGDAGEAERAATGHLERAQGRGSRLEAAIALEARAGARWFGGDLAGALGDAELALSFSEGAWDAATVVLQVIKGLVLLEGGELDAARRALDIPEEVEARLPGSWGWFLLPAARGRLALALGDPSTARDQGLLTGDRLLAVEAPTAGFASWRPLASQAAARLGERDQALELAREELERARAGEATASTTGVALANLGAIEGGDVGLDALRESVRILEACPARLERAKALVELGAALRRAGWDRDAREQLRKGLEGARACEAETLAERATEELLAAGARPRRPALSGVESLTPSERRVAEMAARGLSNREIAQALFITLRTVETHLTHAYSKLDISSRQELRAALKEDRAQS
jgi:DNA-binding CsgD family transcriptional regulator